MEGSINMSSRDRIYYPRKYKQFNQDLTNHEITFLGFDNLSKLELFKLAVAYGLDDPSDFDGAKEGLFLLKDIKSTYDESLFYTVKLGVAENNDQIDEYCDIGLNFDEAERCACTGFGRIKELLESTQDEDLLIKKCLWSLKNYILQM